MKAFFEGIQSLFENFLFIPFNALRNLELENWWAANTISWIFILIGIVAFVYWMGQLSKYNKSGEEDKSITSHSYL